MSEDGVNENGLNEPRAPASGTLLLMWEPYVCLQCGHRACPGTRPGFVRLRACSRQTTLLSPAQCGLIGYAVCLN